MKDDEYIASCGHIAQRGEGCPWCFVIPFLKDGGEIVINLVDIVE